MSLLVVLVRVSEYWCGHWWRSKGYTDWCGENRSADAGVEVTTRIPGDNLEPGGFNSEHEAGEERRRTATDSICISKSTLIVGLD